MVVLVLILSITALAHPGRTDSSGGHTNHSTGEYHYHHGYSAHSHSDMDGDGIVDCPYDFKVQAEESSNDKAKTSSGIQSVPPANQNSNFSNKANDFWDEDTFDNILGLFLVLLLLCGIIRIFSKTISDICTGILCGLLLLALCLSPVVLIIMVFFNLL